MDYGYMDGSGHHGSEENWMDIKSGWVDTHCTGTLILKKVTRFK